MPNPKVACETLVTTGQVVVGWWSEIKAYLDVQEIAREVIRKIGYTKVSICLKRQFMRRIVCDPWTVFRYQPGRRQKTKEEQGRRWPGMMFGYATDETEDYMPLALDLAHKLLLELAVLEKRKQTN